MVETAVAYSFSLNRKEQNCSEGYNDFDEQGFFERQKSLGICDTPENNRIQIYISSEQCRLALREKPATESVIVCNEAGSVTPINLAAALCHDAPERDVYLMEDAPDNSLVSRARVAGIRGILDNRQAQRLLSWQGQQLFVPDAGSSQQSGSTTLPVLEKPAQLQVVESRPTSRPLPEITVVRATETSAAGRVVGFFSGRGGVGKSTVSLMTAFGAQQRGARVALVDLDLQFGDLGYLAGKEPSSRIQRLKLSQVCTKEGLPELVDDALTLLLAFEQPEQGEQFGAMIPQLIADLASRRDLVIINTGSFWMGAHAQTLRCCNQLALLMDQRATSIEACRQAASLCLRLQVPQARLLFLLNGCGRHAALTTQDVSLALGGVEVIGLADGGSLVDELLALGCPMELLTSENAFVSSLKPLLNVLLNQSSIAVASDETLKKSGHGAKIFDLTALRNFFKGAHRVAT